MARRYYQLLRVERDADLATIKRAYRREARRFHPDQNPGDPDAEERFKAIAEAYRVLGDDQLRRMYDRYGIAPAGAAFADVPARIEFGVGDAVRNIARAARERLRARRGADIRLDVALSFVHAIKGTTRVFELPRRGPHGGVEARRLAFDLPPGLRDKQVLRWPGEGEPGVSGGRAGDLFVELQVGTHAVLRRRGKDIVTSLPLSVIELHDGATVTVPTVWGPRSLVVPPDTQPGDELRLPERGVPGEPAGDAVFCVTLSRPDMSRPEVRAAVERAYAEDDPRGDVFQACLLESRRWSE